MKNRMILMCVCIAALAGPAVFPVFADACPGGQDQVLADQMLPDQDTKKDQQPLNSLERQGFAGIFFRTAAALLLILAVVYGISWAMKRMLAPRRGIQNRAVVTIAGSAFLGPKKSIYLVDVQGKRLVLGVTDSAITMLTELEIPETNEADGASGRTVSGGIKSAGFKQILDSFLKQNRRGQA